MKDSIIETGRLIIRRWREEDADALFLLASDPQVGPNAGWPPHKSVEESLEVIRNIFSNDCTWAITSKATGELIGCIGYYTSSTSNIEIGTGDAEVGYWIGRPYWNMGYCTEALRAMIAYCRENLHIETLWADYFIDNPASGRVMEKCGFKDTLKVNYCSNLLHGKDKPVLIMRLDIG